MLSKVTLPSFVSKAICCLVRFSVITTLFPPNGAKNTPSWGGKFVGFFRTRNMPMKGRPFRTPPSLLNYSGWGVCMSLCACACFPPSLCVCVCVFPAVCRTSFPKTIPPSNKAVAEGGAAFSCRVSSSGWRPHHCLRFPEGRRVVIPDSASFAQR